MKRLATVPCFVVLAWACGADHGGLPQWAEPSPVPSADPLPDPPPPSPATAVQVISVGEEINDVLLGSDRIFELTAPASGVLVAELSWDPWVNVASLGLQLGEALFGGWGLIIGRLQVTSGETYRLTVIRGGTEWFHHDPFVLTTSLEHRVLASEILIPTSGTPRR